MKKLGEEYNIYLINKKSQWKTLEDEKKVKIQKIFIMISLFLLIITLIFVIQNILQMLQKNKEYKQYEAQLLAIKRQEEEKQAQIEAEKERIRQEKNS